MKKCDCYHIQPTIKYRYNSVNGDPIPYTKQKGVCWGTREQDECYCDGDKTKCDFYPEVRKRALEEVESEFGEWVSVDDRLPEVPEKVLVCYQTGVKFFGFKDFDVCYYMDRKFTRADGCVTYPTVTHWMPLPEPPKI